MFRGRGIVLFEKEIKTVNQKKKEAQLEEVKRDIEKIDLAIATCDEQEMKNVHIYTDGKYGSYVSQWGLSTYCYNKDYGYNYELLGKDSLKHNLNVMKAKLQGIKCDFESKGEACTNTSEVIQSSEAYSCAAVEKKIFISHSSKDKEYVEIFVSLLEMIGLQEDEIVCSSVPPYCIPLNNKVYDWLADKFQNCELHVFYMLSHNYYSSAACLNEMGAAWAMKQNWTGILLPGFDFASIKGCIDVTQIGIKIDDLDRNTLKYRLDELKEQLTLEFSLRKMSSSLWERKRDEFLSRIEQVIYRDNDDTINENGNEAKTDKITNDACILLAYASNERSGQILMVSDICGTNISVGNYCFNKSDNAREISRWESSIEELLSKKYIKSVGNAHNIFQVTNEGYIFADLLVDQLHIDFANNPEVYLEI